MSLKPCSFCFCCKVYLGTKLICVIEILRVCIIGFILIIESVSDGVSFLLFHFIFRNEYPVSIIFSYLSVHSIRTFTCLNSRVPNWEVLKVYYKLKGYVSLIWITEITVALILRLTAFTSMNLPLDAVILSYLGSLLDIYFAFCIYSCMKLGESGRLAVQPQQTLGPNLGTQPNDEVYIAREFKEVMAYPDTQPVPKCEFIVVHDYTKSKSEDN